MSPAPQADVVLPADERSPAAARRHVRAVLEEAGREDVLDVALLLTTELVTNSVLHAGTTTTVDVAPGPQAVTITVTDCAPGGDSIVRTVPQAAANSDHDEVLLREGGRGIPLLSALATRWGIVHTPTTKSVWFDLGASPAATVAARARPRTATAPRAATCRG
ncbi:MAG TPA: ATP-binding protein [Mycobacteriales bacterium]|nr:ATP-binding protein [Mycobacteriales bacterium]